MTWKHDAIDIEARGIATRSATSIAIQEEKRKKREAEERKRWRKKFEEKQNEPVTLVAGSSETLTVKSPERNL